ncbi:MAG: DUF4091 domain-containing protein [Akkermansiaceae bacterium]
MLEQEAKPSVGIKLLACRNETESLQVVATAKAKQLADLTFHFEAAVSDSGSLVPAPILYWQYDIPVTKSSPRAPLKTGLYPDALIPFQNTSKPNIRAFRGLNGRVNFRLWVDLKIPQNQTPGIYHGKCILKKSGEVISEISYTIQIVAETLPKRPALKSYFGLNEHRIAELSGLDRVDDGIALSRVMDDYYQLMMDCRVGPGLVYATSAPIMENGDLLWSSPASPTLPAAKDITQRYFKEGKFRCLHLPMWRDYPFQDPLGKDRLKAVAYLAELAKLFKQAAPEADLIFSVGSLDEPDNRETYEKIRQWSVLVRSASQISNEKISFFVTEQPEPQSREWGTLTGAVDIWSPHVMWAWEDLESNKGKEIISKRIDSGDEVWCYPALSQFRDIWKHEKGEPNTLRDSYPPVWLTDYPGIHYRILPWICAAKQFSGIHYWNVFHWPQGTNPWKDAGSFIGGDETFNGDGLLIYPPAPTELRGGMTATPCPSIRLKWIRDGMEDYDHLKILQNTHPKRAADILSGIARGFADWETSPKEVFQARRAISEAMLNSP